MATGGFEALERVLPGYTFAEELGRGAYGVVFAARHRRLAREVAIKLLPAELMRDGAARERFSTEAQLLAALDHPHIVRVYDYVEEESICAFVMERLSGGSLADRMRLGMPYQAACAVMLAALNGLEHAHQQGVLHRDVKPDNLLFAGNGLLKVSDFGIAKVLGEGAVRLTMTDAALGTPAYMAPEQLRGGDELGPATDVWAAAAVLYELLAGQRPYRPRGSIPATLMARTLEPAVSLTAVRGDVPAPLAAAVMHGLEREPLQRPSGAAEFAEELEEAGARSWGPDWLRTVSTPIHRTPRRGSIGSTTTVVPATAPARRSRGLPGRAAGAGVALLLAAIIAVVVALAGGSGGPGTIGGPAPGNLPRAPAGWPRTLPIGADEAVDAYPAQAHKFGRFALASEDLGGDPVSGNDWSHQGPELAYSQAMEIVRAGLFPYVTFYSIETLGNGAKGGNAQVAQGPQLLRQFRDPRLMPAYWSNVRKLLLQLGRTHRPLALAVEPGAFGVVIAQVNGKPPSRIPADNAPAHVGVPNTIAGFAQAWIKLRNRLAPNVMLGYPIDDYAFGDYIDKVHPSIPTVLQWAAEQAQWYHELHAHFDFTAYSYAVPDFGLQPRAFAPKPTDYPAQLAYIKAYVRASGTRIVLQQVPAGNTIMRAENNTRYHYQDTHVQYLLGESGFSTLEAWRNAGVIGIEFGANNNAPLRTCPCDAAQDGATNPPAIGTNTEFSSSNDDDGGYLALQLARYTRDGGMLVR